MDEKSQVLSVQDAAEGCLLGLLLGDALGSTYEGSPVDALHARFSGPSQAFEYACNRDHLRYTDDGQMALATTEYLCEHSDVDPNSLMSVYVQHYESWRGYGRGARVLIEAFRDQADYEFMAEHLFPGGSLGNGGAMRSAPAGLAYKQHDVLWEQAKQIAWPTHRHELGIEGTQLIALATRLSYDQREITPNWLASELLQYCRTTVFDNRLKKLKNLQGPEQLSDFGNGIEAHESVVTALGCFALHPNDFRGALTTSIWLGGDTDTIGAMAGALVGVRVGKQGLPADPLKRLEDGDTFLAKMRELSERLASAVASDA